MPEEKAQVISIKKLKKDGSIDNDILNTVTAKLMDDRLVIAPIDFINGICCIDNRHNYDRLMRLQQGVNASITRLIASFKMLESYTVISKLEFDFLHRIWPGEMSVFLKEKDHEEQRIPLRMPRGKMCQDMINAVEKPLLFSPLMKSQDHLQYHKSAIMNTYRDTVDCILIIEEFCKDHTLPTVLDISNGDLKILNEGRISSEEIKSLYFLGKDDSTE
ncbi:MAG: Sua5/YciO/YrdC/YwlC family protein [Spirochaetes bacterium]|nr:Sua5/YciO/YrdC/YwlC family protein [Spirochaetota bacterium]